VNIFGSNNTKRVVRRNSAPFFNQEHIENSCSVVSHRPHPSDYTTVVIFHDHFIRETLVIDQSCLASGLVNIIKYQTTQDSFRGTLKWLAVLAKDSLIFVVCRLPLEKSDAGHQMSIREDALVSSQPR
jgi:hypothetical protein